MVSRTMSRFDLHRKHPSACLHAVGPDAASIKTLLLSLSTIAGTKISNPPWVNFQSAGWVSFQSAPTRLWICRRLVKEISLLMTSLRAVEARRFYAMPDFTPDHRR